MTRVISGGQTGADKTGLVEARKRSIKTGGWAPKGYRTEAGKDLELRDIYGLKESPTSDYNVRTWSNVQDSDVTVWFGNIGTPGYVSTRNAAKCYSKVLVENPSPEVFRAICDQHEIVNIAGNRLSKNARVVGMVEHAFTGLDDAAQTQPEIR